MSPVDDVRNFSTRRRNLLFLMQRYLLDNGYYGAAEALKSEARISDDFELCDNVDLDAMYLEYANYYNLKFGKYPKFLKKTKPTVKVEVTAASVGGVACSETQAKRKLVKAQAETLTTIMGVVGGKPPNDGPNRQPASEKRLDIVGITTAQQPKQQTLPESVEHDMTTAVSAADEVLFNSVDWQMVVELVKSTIVRTDTKITWQDICGNQQAVELIKEAVLTPIDFPQLFVHGLKPWRSILLHGPPGSGKTLLAKALCGEAQRKQITFFNITASLLVSKWRGESEKILRVLFHMAEKRAPSVIFLDEIEGLTSKRDRPTDHESSKRFKNELLQLLDGMEHQLTGVFMLASTNLPWEIDEAFLRRFEKKLLVQLPTAVERSKLIGRLLALNALSIAPLQLEKLVRLSEHFTGDEIRLACKEIAMQNVRRVTRATCKQLPTTMMGVMGGASGAGNSNRCDSETLERAFQQIKPISIKLMTRHEQWQQEHGS